MLKKVVFLGLAATAVATACAAKRAAQHRDEFKSKSRKDDATATNSQTANQSVKVPVRRCPAYALIDVKSLRKAYQHSRLS